MRSGGDGSLTLPSRPSADRATSSGNLSQNFVLQNGWRVLVRPCSPADESLLYDLFSHVTPEDRLLRFFAPVKEIGHAFIARLLGTEGSWSLRALDEESGRAVGLAHLNVLTDGRSGEFAILVRSDLKGRGLGWRLMQLIRQHGVAVGLSEIRGEVRLENTKMLQMCRELGFRVRPDPDDAHVLLVSLTLNPKAA